jgi:hypothetical protein
MIYKGVIKELKLKKAYILHKTENKTLVCKVLNEYNSEQEAEQDLINLLAHKKKEKELLTDYTQRPI